MMHFALGIRRTTDLVQIDIIGRNAAKVSARPRASAVGFIF